MSNRSPAVRRRAFVASAGVALGAIAGCLGGDNTTGNGSNGNDSSGNQSNGNDSSGNQSNDSDGTNNEPDDEPPAPVFDDLETATAGYPEYAPWLAGDEQTVFSLDFEREQEVEAYSRTEIDRSEDGPFPEIDTLAEALAANSGISPQLVLARPIVGVSYPFLQQFSFVGEDGESDDPIMRVERATLGDQVIVLDGELDHQRLRDLDTVTGSLSQNGYTIHQSKPQDRDALPFGVTDGTVVLSFGGQGERAPSERLRDAIETATSGVSVGADADWLLEHCGGGAFVSASTENISGEETQPPSGQDPPDFGVGTERAERFRETVVKPSTAAVSVLDSHSEGHVTRNGFAFESEAAMLPSEELGELLAPGARERTVVTEQNLAIVEAFW